MKRIIAFIGVTMMIIGMLSPLAVKADGGTISLDIGLNAIDKITLYELTMALQEGAELSWEDLDLGSALLSNEEKARRILAYYKYKAMGLVSEGAVSTIEFLFDSEVDKDHETAAITFQASSGINSTVKNSILDGVVNQYYDNTLDVKAPINLETIAFWNRYGTYYINKYVKDMNAVPEGSDVNIPTAYVPYLNSVNSDSTFFGSPAVAPIEGYPTVADFFWKDYVDSSQSSETFYYGADPAILHTFVSINNYLPTDDIGENAIAYIKNNNTNVWTSHIIGAMSGVLDLYVTSINGTYSVSCENLQENFTPWFGHTGSFMSTGHIRMDVNNSNMKYSFDTVSISNDTVVNKAYSGSLSEVLLYIALNFKNVNVYVDGQLWSLANYVPITGGLTVTIPDAVIDNSNEDGKIVNVPIALPYDSATDQFIDSNVNLDKVFDAIADKIAQGATSIKLQDLVDAGAIEGTDGIPLTDSDFKIIPLISLLTKARVTPRDISIDDVIPSLPTLPSLGIGQNPAFEGITVLSRIINVTNQSLPEDLVMCFYGVVFGMVILGIIKIMHK